MDENTPNADAKPGDKRKPRGGKGKKTSGSGLADGLYDQGEVKGAKSARRAAPLGKTTRQGSRTNKSRQNAQRVLDDCHDKLVKLKEEFSETATDQLETVFEHGKEMLADDWEPKHLIRDTVSLSLNAVDSWYRLYDAAFRLLKPTPRP